MNPLAAYIDKELKKGFPEELIRQKLKTAGYSAQEITDAFHDHETKQHYNKFIDSIVEQETKHRWLFIIIILLLLTGGIITAIYLLYMNGHTLTLLSQKQEPTTEQDCSDMEFKQKEQCIMKIAAMNNDSALCVNITSKVMKYECKTQVWNKNYCNYLILTDQPSC